MLRMVARCCFGTPEERQASAVRVGRVLQLIVASKEYQFA